MAKRKSTDQRQTMIYKTLNRTLKIELREAHKYPGINSGTQEG